MPDETAPAPRKRKTQPRQHDPELWYGLFVSLGPTRSLPVLLEHAASIGLKTPVLSTVKEWSTRHDWQDRARAFDDGVAASREGLLTDDIIAMNARQAETGRMLAKTGAELVARTKGGGHNEGARLVEVGVKVERLAMGAATERSEIAVGFVNSMLPEIVQLIVSVNMVVDPGDRLDQITAGIDEIARRFVIST